MMKGQKSKKTFEVDQKAPVFVFDERQYGIRKKAPVINTRRSLGETRSNPPVASTSADADEIADMEVNEIWERLRDTMDDIHASNLKGRERNKHLYAKAIRLGAKPPPAQQHPMNMGIGIRRKQQERESKRLARAREMDVITSATTTITKNGRVTKGTGRKKHNK